MPQTTYPAASSHAPARSSSTSHEGSPRMLRAEATPSREARVSAALELLASRPRSHSHTTSQHSGIRGAADGTMGDGLPQPVRRSRRRLRFSADGYALAMEVHGGSSGHQPEGHLGNTPPRPAFEIASRVASTLHGGYVLPVAQMVIPSLMNAEHRGRGRRRWADFGFTTTSSHVGTNAQPYHGVSAGGSDRYVLPIFHFYEGDDVVLGSVVTGQIYMLETDLQSSRGRAARTHLSELQSLPLTQDLALRLDTETVVATCTICQERFTDRYKCTPPHEVETRFTVYRLPCNHVFCEDCLKVWLRHSSTCPNCRAVLKNAEAAYTRGGAVPAWWAGGDHQKSAKAVTVDVRRTTRAADGPKDEDVETASDAHCIGYLVNFHRTQSVSSSPASSQDTVRPVSTNSSATSFLGFVHDELPPESGWLPRLHPHSYEKMVPAGSPLYTVPRISAESMGQPSSPSSTENVNVDAADSSLSWSLFRLSSSPDGESGRLPPARGAILATAERHRPSHGGLQAGETRPRRDASQYRERPRLLTGVEDAGATSLTQSGSATGDALQPGLPQQPRTNRNAPVRRSLINNGHSVPLIPARPFSAVRDRNSGPQCNPLFSAVEEMWPSRRRRDG